MSKPAEHAPPAAASRSRFARLRSLLGGLFAAAKRRPKLSIALGSLGVVAFIGFVIAYTLASPAEKSLEPELKLADALQHLQAGELATARSIATKLKSEDKLSYDERGGTSYVLGAALAREATANPHPDEQRRLYLVAARYLDAAYRDEFAQATSVEGLMLLGQCWHDAGRYARALPILTAALKRRPRQTTELHRLLASSYFHDANPQYKPALEHVRKYLADRMLKPADRHAGQLQEARILLAAAKPDDARQVVAAIPEKSELSSAVKVLQARLVMQQAEQLQGEAARMRWHEAMALLRTPPGRDTTSVDAQREAQYLLGICYLKTEDFRAAEKQFSRSRRINLGLPEGIASALEEADLQRIQGKDELALEVYQQLLRELGDLSDYSNCWLSLDQLRERLLAALRYYRDAEKFDIALQFVRSLAPLLNEPRMLELKGEIYRRWGDRLMVQAVAGGDTDEKLAAVARSKYHEAAEHFYRLARRSLSAREYPDYLWQSAECYDLAHDFHRTIRVTRMFLDQNQPQRRPEALLAIAESELALGNLAASLTTLRQLLRDDPKHPLTYQARIVAQQVLLEQGKFAEARRMLMDNLDHESLTPRSLEWRDSLFALGLLLHRQGIELEAASRDAGVDSEDPEKRKAGEPDLEASAAVFHDALLRLTEAIERYPDAPQAIEARYAAAEAYRQAAKWPRKKLPGVTIETTRAALVRQMNEELSSAHQLYGQLIDILNTRQDDHPLGVRDREILRNCYFLQADALFDLGKYEEAIQAYSSATNRYQNRPEAIEAFVQIASCYRQLDQPIKARGTLEQAKVVLQRIPEDAQFDQTTRFSRGEWITLLDFLSTL
ncbi:MAG TPA: tetratricopeptide repeat protein [Pirellulaceae bacterium]|nr:tetratricopeptide repeat protein [Pirellulaceae bacterium]